MTDKIEMTNLFDINKMHENSDGTRGQGCHKDFLPTENLEAEWVTVILLIFLERKLRQSAVINMNVWEVDTLTVAQERDDPV